MSFVIRTSLPSTGRTTRRRSSSIRTSRYLSPRDTVSCAFRCHFFQFIGGLDLCFGRYIFFSRFLKHLLYLSDFFFCCANIRRFDNAAHRVTDLGAVPQWPGQDYYNPAYSVRFRPPENPNVRGITASRTRILRKRRPSTYSTAKLLRGCRGMTCTQYAFVTNVLSLF